MLSIEPLLLSSASAAALGARKTPSSWELHMSAHISHSHSSHEQDASRIQQLRAAAKQALLRHKFLEARHILDEAVALHPDSYKLHRLRCVASACLGDYESALEDAEVVIDLMPSMSAGYYHKGFALHQLHDYAGAAHAFQQGLELNPTDKIMRQGFWDAVNLLSQDRPVGVALPAGAAGGLAGGNAGAANGAGGYLMSCIGEGSDRNGGLAALLADD